MIIRSISVTLLPAYAHYKSYTQIFQAIYKTDSFISLPALLCIVFSFRSIWHCFTAYSHYMCCWQILQHTKKRRTPHFTYGARHFVYRSYTPLILLMLNFTDARYPRYTVQWFCQMRRSLPGSCLRAFFSPMPYGLRNLQRCALLQQHIPRNPVMS